MPAFDHSFARGLALLLVALVCVACGGESRARAAETTTVAADTDTAFADFAFVPFDSTTLVAECRHAVTPAEDSTWRLTIARIGGRDGVVLYANPEPTRPCFQMGVVSPALRDTVARELRAARVPAHLVTFLHITEVPEDDITAGARR